MHLCREKEKLRWSPHRVWERSRHPRDHNSLWPREGRKPSRQTPRSRRALRMGSGSDPTWNHLLVLGPSSQDFLFTNKKTEAQRAELICSKSQSQFISESSLESRSLDSQPRVLSPNHVLKRKKSHLSSRLAQIPYVSITQFLLSSSATTYLNWPYKSPVTLPAPWLNMFVSS